VAKSEPIDGYVKATEALMVTLRRAGSRRIGSLRYAGWMTGLEPATPRSTMRSGHFLRLSAGVVSCLLSTELAGAGCPPPSLAVCGFLTYWLQIGYKVGAFGRRDSASPDRKRIARIVECDHRPRRGSIPS